MSKTSSPSLSGAFTSWIALILLGALTTTGCHRSFHICEQQQDCQGGMCSNGVCVAVDGGTEVPAPRTPSPDLPLVMADAPVAPADADAAAVAQVVDAAPAGTVDVSFTSIDTATPLDSSGQVSPWPMFGYNPQHTGLSPYNGPSQRPSVQWMFRAGTQTMNTGSAVIGADGMVYVGTSQALYAIEQGVQKWAFAPETGQYRPMYSGPALARDGTIYTTGSKLYAVNPDGTLRWSVAVTNANPSPPTLAPDGTIYVTSEQALLAVGPDGHIKWTVVDCGTNTGGTALAKDGTIYVSTKGGNLVALSPDGEKLWGAALGSLSSSSPAVADDGTIYVGIESDSTTHGKGIAGYLMAFNVDGTRKWIANTGSNTLATPSIAPDQTVVVGDYNARVYAFLPNGQRKWLAGPIGALITGKAAIGADGTVYIGGYGSDLVALDPASGAELWRSPVGGSPGFSPIIGPNGLLYAGCGDDSGTFYALR